MFEKTAVFIWQTTFLLTFAYMVSLLVVGIIFKDEVKEKGEYDSIKRN